MSVVKDTTQVKSNVGKVWSGLKGLFGAAVGIYLATAVIHDVATGESLFSKTWNSAVVTNMDDTESCGKEGVLDNRFGNFICEPSGEGKGLETLKPGFMK